MEEYQRSFSVISLTEYSNRQLDRDGDRVRVHELLDPDSDLDITQPSDTQQRVLQGFATNSELTQRQLAVTFLAGIISAKSDEVFRRDTIDFHILSASLGTTGLRAIGFLREDYLFPGFIDGQPTAQWEVNPLPLDIARKPGQPPQYVSTGFFTRWPSNHDLQKLLTQSS